MEYAMFKWVLGLDYFHPHIQKSLHQANMATEAQSQTPRLFVGVEEMWDLSIKLAYCKEDKEEVKEFIATMPLILQEKFGSRVWKWFDSDAQEYLQGHLWSPETGLLSNLDDTYIQALNNFKKYENLDNVII